MIFVKKEQKVIRISKHTVDDGGVYALRLTHNMTNSDHMITDLKNGGMNSGYWIFYNVDLSYLQSGEYTYFLYRVGDDNPIENGLLQVYADIQDPISYRRKEDSEKTIVYRR